MLYFRRGRDSSVGIATRYGLDGPGIESERGARFSTPVHTGRGGPPSLLYNGYQVFPGGKAGRAWCRGHERVGLYLYSPSGPSWPVIGRTFTSTLLYFTADDTHNRTRS